MTKDYSREETKLFPLFQQALNTTEVINEDVVLKEWKELIKLFPNLEKYDKESIGDYSNTDLDRKYNAAINFFKKFHSARVFYQEMLKVFVICFQYKSQCIDSLDNTDDTYTVFIKFLMILLQDSVNIHPFNESIIDIVKSTIERLHKGGKDPTLALYEQFQILALVAALSSNKEQTLVLEILKKAIEESFKSISLKEIYKKQFSGEERWETDKQQYVKVVVELNRKKLLMIWFAKEPPKFSIRFIGIYYIQKLIQGLSLDNKNKGDLLILLTEILKDTSEELKESMKEANEVALNEIMICFNIIEIIYSDELFNNWDYTSSLITLTENYFNSLIKYKLLGSITNTILNTPMSDYAANFFEFLNNLNKKEVRWEMLNKMLMKVIEKLDTDIREIKYYIVEYICNDKNANVLIMNLLSTKAICFTSPLKGIIEESSFILEDPLEKLISKRLIRILNKRIESRPEETFEYLLKELREHIQEEGAVFGICKLLYCGIIKKEKSNKSYNEMVRKPYDYKRYLIYKDLEQPKSFINTKGIIELTNILFKSFNVTIELLIGELVNLKGIADQLLHDNKIFKEILEYSKKSNILLKRLLFIIKYKGDDMTDNDSEVVLKVLDFLNSIDNEDELVSFSKLIADFIAHKEDDPSNHKLKKMLTKANEILFNTLNKSTKRVLNLLKNYLLFLREPQVNRENVMTLDKIKQIAKLITSQIKLSKQELEGILKMILEIVFESSIDLNVKTEMLIERKEYLVAYFEVLVGISEDKKWEELIKIHCRNFFSNVNNSYKNCMFLSEVI